MSNNKPEPFKERIRPDKEKLRLAAVPTLGNLASAVAGAGLGSYLEGLMGWPSLLVGPVIMYAGQYSQTPALNALGAGMVVSVASDLLTGSKAASPKTLKDRHELGKARFLAFKDAFAKKTFLDRIFPGSDSPQQPVLSEGTDPGGQTVEGLGAAQGFEILDRIEQNLIASALDQMAAGDGPGPLATLPEGLAPEVIPGDFAPAGAGMLNGLDLNLI